VAKNFDNVIAAWGLFLHRNNTSDLRKIVSLIADELVLDMATRQFDIMDPGIATTAGITTVIRALVATRAKKSLTSLRTFEDLVHSVGMAFRQASMAALIKSPGNRKDQHENSDCPRMAHLSQGFLQPPSGLRIAKPSGLDTKISVSGCRGQQSSKAPPTDSSARSIPRT
jgi:hypothetical protein